MYYNGTRENYRIEITTEADDGRYQWAVVDAEGNLIGYLSFWYDFFSSSISGFGLIAFRDNKPVMMSAIREVMRFIDAQKPHRVEFRAIQGNSAVRGYDSLYMTILARGKYKALKHTLTDVFKDRAGRYRDAYIYEFIRREQ